MDAGLLLAGVSTVVKPPGAPPGKDIETPPAEAKNEFKDVLKQAEGKSSGEVAEAEPNAQPQKLDSTEETSQLQAEPTLDWVSLLSFPLVAPQQVVPTDAMVAVSTPAASLSSPAIPQLAVVSDDVQEVLNVVELKLAENVVVTPTATAPGTSPTPAPTKLVAEPQAKVFQSEEQVSAPELVAVEAPVQKAVVATQATPAAKQPLPVADVVPDAVTQSQSAEPKQASKATKSLESTPASTGIELISDLTSQPTTESETETGSGSAGQHHAAHPEFKLVSEEISQKVEQSAGMTPAERKAVVHQLTQKIEALAVNSVRNEVTIRMEPAELGTVLVQVSRGLGEMTASLSATNEKLHNTLHEARNELAASLTAKVNATVKVEIIAADSTPMNSTANSNQHSSSSHQPRQEAITKFFHNKTSETQPKTTLVARQSSSLIDLEG